MEAGSWKVEGAPKLEREVHVHRCVRTRSQKNARKTPKEHPPPPIIYPLCC